MLSCVDKNVFFEMYYLAHLTLKTHIYLRYSLQTLISGISNKKSCIFLAVRNFILQKFDDHCRQTCGGVVQQLCTKLEL